jgi:hypothetical protein
MTKKVGCILFSKVAYNVKNKSSMELENKVKCVLMDFEINEITLQEATKRILLLLDVVGRSEQYCDWCSSTEEVEVKICKRCRRGMDDHR